MKGILVVIVASILSATFLTGLAALYAAWGERRRSKYRPVGKW